MTYFRRFGKGKTVILQHGFLGGSGYWDPVGAALYRHFDVVIPDLPGFASGAGEALPSSIVGYAENLVALMDELKVDRFSIVGHSMGGMIAQQLTLDFSHRVERLVLYGTAPSGSLPTRFESFESTIRRFKAVGHGATDDVIASWFVDGKEHPFYEFTRAAGKGFSVEAAINAMTIVPRWSVADRLGEIKAQTLIMAADRDFATTPDLAMQLWKGIRGSRLAVIPGCSHNIHLEKSGIFNDLLLTFLLTGH